MYYRVWLIDKLIIGWIDVCISRMFFFVNFSHIDHNINFTKNWSINWCRIVSIENQVYLHASLSKLWAMKLTERHLDQIINLECSYSAMVDLLFFLTYQMLLIWYQVFEYRQFIKRHIVKKLVSKYRYWCGIVFSFIHSYETSDHVYYVRYLPIGNYIQSCL